MDQIEGITIESVDEASVLLVTLLNFCTCIFAAFFVRTFYLHRAYSISGKKHIGSILPILSCVVFMVIVVVKSSLALSLGLIGALSIVRFRTPVKEPEDLAYLFLAIAIGIGYGAGHLALTSMLLVVLLGVIYFWLSNRCESDAEFNLIVDWQDSETPFTAINLALESCLQEVQLIRLERGPEVNRAILLILISSSPPMDDLLKNLREVDPSVSVTFFETQTNL
jgi:hypothetical protein